VINTIPHVRVTRPREFTIAARPARVCFLIDNLSRAGTETQLLALLQAFDRTRVAPTLALLDGDDATSRALEPTCCPVLRLGVKSLASRRAWSAARTFSAFLRRHGTDVLQAYFLDSLYFGVPVARWAGVSKIVRVRNNLGYWLTRKHRLLNRVYRTLVDVTLTNSDAGRASLEAEGVPADRVAVLENGVDVERFAASPRAVTGEMRVGVVANLRPIKGLDVFVRAASQLLARHPALRFEIAGDGPQRGELQSQIDSLNLTDRVRLLGAVADVPAFLASLDVAVLPSRSEGMSNAILEYMAAGRAIVATKVGANGRLVRDGVDGLLVAPEDVTELANAIERLITDRDMARALGTSARRRACESFSRDAMRLRFEDFYAMQVQGHGSDCGFVVPALAGLRVERPAKAGTTNPQSEP